MFCAYMILYNPVQSINTQYNASATHKLYATACDKQRVIGAPAENVGDKQVQAGHCPSIASSWNAIDNTWNFVRRSGML